LNETIRTKIPWQPVKQEIKSGVHLLTQITGSCAIALPDLLAPDPELMVLNTPAA